MSRPALVALGGLIFIFVYALFRQSGMNDFLTYYEWGQGWLQGRPLSQAAPSTGMYIIYAPFFAPLIAVLALLPYTLAVSAWVGLKLVGYALSVLTLRRLKVRRRDLWITGAVFLGWIDSDLRLGQVNSLILTAMFLAIFRWQGWGQAAAWTGAVAKLTPAVYLPLLPRKTVVRSLLLATALFTLTCLRLWQSPLAIVHQWIESATNHKMQGVEAALLANQSLLGVFSRLAPSFPMALWAITSGAILAGAGWWTYRQSHRGVLWELYSLLTCVMLLVSPDSRPVHELFLFIPFVRLLALTAQSSVRLRRLAFCELAMFIALSLLSNPDLFATPVRDFFFRINSHTCMYLLFAFTFAWRSRTERP